MRKFLRLLEPCIAVICLLIYSGSPHETLLSNGFATKDADRFVFRAFYSFTYVASVGLIIPHLKRAAYLLIRDKFILALVTVATLSLLWSADPETTVRRAIGLAGTTLFGVYLAARYSLKQQLKLCALTFGLSAIICFVFAILLPHYGIDHQIVGGAWRGIYTNKNTLGKRFVLSTSIFLFLIVSTRKQVWISWAGYIASTLLILLSTSKTSLMNLGLITATSYFTFWILRWKPKLRTIIVMLVSAVTILMSGWLSSNLNSVLSIVGRDATLTGRTDLWPWVITMIQRKPWLGYGYGAFWLGPGSESEIVIKAVRWNAPNAHNGLLDVWLSIGLLGAALFLIGFILNYLRAISLVFWRHSSVGYWLLIYLTFIFLSNLTETTLLDQNSIEWVLYVAVVLSSWSNRETSAELSAV